MARPGAPPPEGNPAPSLPSNPRMHDPVRTAPSPPPPPRRLRGALGLVAALAGGAVLLQELLAAGWIAPLHGSGIDVWAAILSVSLLALAIGAWVGSRTAGWGRSLVGPLLLLALGGVLLAAGTGLVVRSDPGDPVPLFAAALGLLLPPLLVFGALSPWLVERYAATGYRAGRAAGVVYAAGTFGSAAGALAGGLWLVPWLGLSGTTFAAALALPVGGVLAALLAGRSRRTALIAGALAVVGIGLLHGWRPAPSAIPGAFGLRSVERVDGWYGRHEVLEDDVARYLLVDGILQTSAPRDDVGSARPGDLLRAGNALELAIWLRPEGKRALVIGLGGAAFPRRLGDAGWQVEAVEIDPDVVRLARRHFGLVHPVHIEDGRSFLQRTDERFALLVLDVYRGEHLPGHLFTEEAFARMRDRLTDDGLLAVNLIGQADSPDVLAVLRACRAVFPEAALFAPDDGKTLSPMTLFASTTGIEDPSSRDRADAAGVPWPSDVSLDALPWEEAERLTDDRNPLNLLRRPTAARWRTLSRRRFARAPE